jgi:hypothetical protein
MMLASGFPTSAKQSPPIPAMWGSVMQTMAQAVTAASTALSLSLNILMAARVASGKEAVVMPLVPTAMDLPTASKLLLFDGPP